MHRVHGNYFPHQRASHRALASLPGGSKTPSVSLRRVVRAHKIDRPIRGSAMHRGSSPGRMVARPTLGRVGDQHPAPSESTTRALAASPKTSQRPVALIAIARPQPARKHKAQLCAWPAPPHASLRRSRAVYAPPRAYPRTASPCALGIVRPEGSIPFTSSHLESRSVCR